MKRRLAAILAADLVGYSRLVGTDEEGTLTKVKSVRVDIIEPLIAENRGRVVKLMGDGFLVEFQSAVDAVKCALQWQKSLSGQSGESILTFRIGVNLGDIVVDGKDIVGDGVNVAARLESLAEPGGIIVSRSVHEQVQDKLDIAFEDMGDVEVKNIARPVRIFRIVNAPVGVGKQVRSGTFIGLSRSVPVLVAALAIVAMFLGYWLQSRNNSFDSASVEKMAFPLPDRPSIAVLPFRNLSEDAKQLYFADGITEDIVADLSKVSGILVVAHGSTQSYRRQNVSFREVAEDLGVHYVLTGSIRRSDQRLRATVQLVDAIRGVHLWGEKYDRNVQDLFAVQSEIAKHVVRAMSVTLKANEHDRLFQKYVTNIDAYDAFLRARATVGAPTRENIANGEIQFLKAIELDPNFAGAYAGLSFNYSVKARFRFGTSPTEDANRSLEFATKAVELDAGLSWSHIALAGAYLANGRHDDAADAVQRALVLQPSGYEANLFTGFYLNFAGQPSQAVKYIEAANELSRTDTIRGLDFLGMAYFTDGQYAKCEDIWLKRFKIFGVPKYPHAHVFLAGAQAAQNKLADAATTVARFQRLVPDFKLSTWRWIDNYKNQDDKNRLYNAAVKAGIPE